MSHEIFHLDLFSGIGGFSLAFEAAGFRTVGFCECEPDRQRDLRHHWPGVPIIGDINDLEGICRVVADSQHMRCDSRITGNGQSRHESGCKSNRCGKLPLILTAGVPCQPASAAGKRKGSADDRWLWPQTIRVVERLRPDWCVFENPLGIASLAQPAAIPGVDIERLRDVPGRTICEILTAIKSLGYELPTDHEGCPWIPVVPAAGVGAFHRRDRLWIIARRGDVGNADATGFQVGQMHGGVSHSEQRNSEGKTLIMGSQERALPNWSDAILERGQDEKWRAVPRATESSVCGVVDGLPLRACDLLVQNCPKRTQALKGLGNSVVPQVAFQIAKAIHEQMI